MSIKLESVAGDKLVLCLYRTPLASWLDATHSVTGIRLTWSCAASAKVDPKRPLNQAPATGMWGLAMILRELLVPTKAKLQLAEQTAMGLARVCLGHTLLVLWRAPKCLQARSSPVSFSILCQIKHFWQLIHIPFQSESKDVCGEWV